MSRKGKADQEKRGEEKPSSKREQYWRGNLEVSPIDCGVTRSLPHFLKEWLDFCNWILCNLYLIVGDNENFLMCTGAIRVLSLPGWV